MRVAADEDAAGVRERLRGLMQAALDEMARDAARGMIEGRIWFEYELFL